MKLDIHEILRKLPHRYPIILVDRVLELVPGERIVVNGLQRVRPGVELAPQVVAMGARS